MEWGPQPSRDWGLLYTQEGRECILPLTIRASSSISSKADTPSKVVEPGKNSLYKVPPSSSSPPKEVEQPGVTEKEAEMTKGVAPNATKPLATPQDPINDNEALRMEIVLATLPLSAKGDPKGKDQGSSEAAVSQSKAPPKEKTVIKK